MKYHFRIIPFASLALAAAVFPGAIVGRADTELQQPAAAAQAEAQEAEPEYSEEEYNAWESADKEPDLQKRGSMLIEFTQKYPKSKLMPHIEATYNKLLFECSNGEKYQELEILAEQWLKIHPRDFNTTAYLAKAAEKLGHDEKCVQCLQEIYQMQPSGSMAYNIAQTYKKMKHKSKYLEWTDTVFKYPDYEGDFKLRYDLVKFHADEKNFAKAAECARAAIKATDLVKQPSLETQEQLRAVRNACYHLMGMKLYEDGKFDEAIQSFQQALQADKYGEGYYYIGLCQWKQDKIDDAMLSFARAELQGGEVAARAKEKLEQLYKALHNNTVVGIDKIYRKAKEQPESAKILK
jgi:tetratricopeptide (TPR) repeat protein